MVCCFLRHVFNPAADILEEIICGALPVKEFPQVDTDGAQAKTVTGVGVEEDGPVVKLLPEHDQWVGYGSFSVLHDTSSALLPDITANGTTTSMSDNQIDAICVPEDLESLGEQEE
jgi:hypothetical protein